MLWECGAIYPFFVSGSLGLKDVGLFFVTLSFECWHRVLVHLSVTQPLSMCASCFMIE
jgi:hypothetical protein